MPDFVLPLLCLLFNKVRVLESAAVNHLLTASTVFKLTSNLSTVDCVYSPCDLQSWPRQTPIR